MPTGAKNSRRALTGNDVQEDAHFVGASPYIITVAPVMPDRYPFIIKFDFYGRMLCTVFAHLFCIEARNRLWAKKYSTMKQERLRSCSTRVTVACGGSLEGCTSAAHKGDAQSKQESLVGIKSLMGHANRRVARRAMGQLQKTLFAQVVRVAARCSNYNSALFTSIDVSLLRSGYSEDDIKMHSHWCKKFTKVINWQKMSCRKMPTLSAHPCRLDTIAESTCTCPLQT